MKTEVIRFRCTPEEKKIIEDHARFDALNVSEYILNLVKEDQRKRIKSVTIPDEQIDGVELFKKLAQNILEQYGESL